MAVALVGLFALISACGGNGRDASGGGLAAASGRNLPGLPGATGSAPSPTAGMLMPLSAPALPATAGVAAAAGSAVTIKEFAFAPVALRVSVGTTVTWTNRDSDAHTVTSDGSGGPLNSKALSTGDTFSYTFTDPGTYKYLCSIHPFMTATVTVTR